MCWISSAEAPFFMTTITCVVPYDRVVRTRILLNQNKKPRNPAFRVSGLIPQHYCVPFGFRERLQTSLGPATRRAKVKPKREIINRAAHISIFPCSELKRKGEMDASPGRLTQR